MKKGVKYGLKFLGWFFLGIIVLLILAGLLIQTRPVKQKLAKVVAKQAENYLNGNILLDKIDGNFFTHLQIENLLWKYDNDTIAFIANLDLSYDLRPLLKRQLLINAIKIDQPFFHLKQVNDSTWNIEKMIKPSSSSTVESTNSGGNFQLDLPDVQLREGRLHISTNDTLIPKKIQHLNTNFSFHLDKLHQSVQMNQFSFIAKKPNVTLSQLTFNVSRDTSIIDLTNFQLKTQWNQLSGKGRYQPMAEEATAHFQTAPLQTKEFEFLFPHLKIPASPKFSLNASIKDDSLKATVELAEKDQKIQLNLTSANFAEFLSKPSQTKLKYHLKVNLEKINLAHWTGNAELDYLINGNITAQGKGTDQKTLIAGVQGNFKDCIFNNKSLDKLAFDFSLNRGNVKGKAEVSGDFGELSVEPEIQNVFDAPTYELELFTQRFNLAELLGNESLQSDINLKANISGRGFHTEILSANAKLNVSPSRFQSLKIDSLLGDLKFEKNIFHIDSLWINTPASRLNLYGNYALKSNSEMWLSASFDSITDFEPFIPVSDLHTSGVVHAHLIGTLDSLYLESMVQLDSASYNTFFLDSLTMNAKAKINPADTLIDAHLTAVQLQNQNLMFDTVLVEAKINTDSMLVNVRIAGEDMISTIKGRVNWQKQLRITLENWLVDYKNQHLALQTPPAVIEIDSANYRIHHFKMASTASDTAQYVLIEGKISRNSDQNLNVKVDNLNVAEIMKLWDIPVKSTGLASLNLSVEGPPVSPVLKGDFGIDNAQLNSYRFTDLGGTFNYANNQLNLQSKIIPIDSGKIELDGRIPFQMALDSLNFSFNPKDSIDLQLNVDKFPLAVLQTFNINENVAGFIDGNVKVTGTVESPDPNGELKLLNASVKMPEYGIDYDNILFHLSFLRNKISLDTLRIETADGNLTGVGAINFSSDFYKGNISQSIINLKFDKFNPLDHRRFNMQLSGNASLGGEKGNVIFDGDLRIPEAEIYLPAILNWMGKLVVPKVPEPILVQALEQQNNIADSLNIGIQPEDTTEQFNLTYFNDITGKLRIKIPKNTWIKNEDLRLELSGDFEIIKHKTFTEIFGSANVVRGQYDMFGRTFKVDEGTIRFEGGENPMPKLNLIASYMFRDTRRLERKLTVTITGDANTPKVDFTLDENAVNEGDALSYILFGKSMNELSMEQQDHLAGAGGGKLAENAAASILSAQISNFLSKKLNVDYIEVKSDNGFDNATVQVGKYLTNDLFVSYEQRFGPADQKDIAKYQVTLEYELFKFLFFQLNNSSTDSGFDLIFKINSK